MPVSHRHKFIYIHVPRTAGTSVASALMNQRVRFTFFGKLPPGSLNEFRTRWAHHIAAVNLKPLVPPWDRYFKFAFVRNPWDRAISAYFYHKQKVDRHRASRSLVEIFKKVKSFDDWVHHGFTIHPSAHYVADRDGKLMVDFVGRFENLETDFAEICSKIGIKANLAHKNGSIHGPYQQYYTPETEEIIRKQCTSDIELFGYRF